MPKYYCPYCEEIVEAEYSFMPSCPDCNDNDLIPCSVCENCGEEFYDDKLSTLCPECYEKMLTGKNVIEYSREAAIQSEIYESVRDCAPFLLWAMGSSLEEILLKEWNALPEHEKNAYIGDYVYNNEEDFAYHIADIIKKEKEMSK